MDGDRFDAAARTFGALLDRRRGVGGLAAAAAVLAITGCGGGVVPGTTSAACTANGRRCGRKGRSCRSCCSRYSSNTADGKRRCTCRPDRIACLNAAQCCGGECIDGRCGGLGCAARGQACGAGTACCDGLDCVGGVCGGAACAVDGEACPPGGAACCAGFGCAAGVCRSAAGLAAGAGSVSVRGVPTCAAMPGTSCAVTITGAFVGSLIARGTLVGTFAVADFEFSASGDFVANEVSGTVTLTDEADATATVVLDVVGALSTTGGAVSLAFEGTHTVAGGTGRFAGATGDGRVVATGTKGGADNGTIDRLSIEGRIVIP